MSDTSSEISSTKNCLDCKCIHICLYGVLYDISDTYYTTSKTKAINKIVEFYKDFGDITNYY